MSIKESDIKNLMHEICYAYNNTRYRIITGDSSFDDVRGNNLWKLWYGDGSANFYVYAMDIEYGRCKRNECTKEELFSMLVTLRDSLEKEFEKLIERKKGNINYELD